MRFSRRMRYPAAALAFMCAGTTAVSTVFYEQNFETDTSGITPRQFDTDTELNLARTESGGGRLETGSQSGNFHLELGLINENGQTGFGYGASWNDNAGAGTFQSGLGTSFWTYFDNPMRQMDNGNGGLNAYEPGDGWFFQPTLLNPAGDTAISGGGFGIQLSSDREWHVAATGNTLGGFEYGIHHEAHPEHDQANFLNGETYIAGEGWYQLETIWTTGGSGGIDQTSNLYDADGNLVFSVLVEDSVSDFALAGTIGSAWVGQDGPTGPNEFGYSGNLVDGSLMGDLAIDNIVVVPEPATVAGIFGVFALMTACTLRNRKPRHVR